MIKIVVCGVLVAGTAVAGLTAASASLPPSPPACAAVNLRPAYGGFQGAAGTFQDLWRLRNVGHTNCRLKGYPTVNNYRADGRPLFTSVSHLGAPRTILLAPNQHASFALRYTDPGVLNCTPEPAAMLTIQTPGAARPVITQRGEKACGGKLQETPLIHGG